MGSAIHASESYVTCRAVIRVVHVGPGRICGNCCRLLREVQHGHCSYGAANQLISGIVYVLFTMDVLYGGPFWSVNLIDVRTGCTYLVNATQVLEEGIHARGFGSLGRTYA